MERLLLVEDDPTLIRMLTSFLASEGFDDVLICYSLGNFLTDANIIWLR